MRKYSTLFLVFVLIITSAGCSEEWRRKFIRKKKEVTKKPRIYQEKKYKKEPTRGLYDKHYNYCTNWLSELSGRLGENHKKDTVCIQEALSHFKDMQEFLIPDKAKEMDKHIKRLTEIKDTIFRQDLGQANKDYVRNSVDREERYIRSELYYDKIKNFMKKSFEEEEEELPAKTEMEGA